MCDANSPVVSQRSHVHEDRGGVGSRGALKNSDDSSHHTERHAKHTAQHNKTSTGRIPQLLVDECRDRGWKVSGGEDVGGGDGKKPAARRLKFNRK